MTLIDQTHDRTATTAGPVADPVATLAARRRDTRWELAAALRHFGRLGYEFGFNGHVSARAPEVPGSYWVNPFGVSVGAVTAEDFVLVDASGQIADSPRGHTINGFAGNLALHEALPEAAVAVHLHTPSGFVWSALGEPLAAVNTDAALIVGLQGLSARLWGDESGPTNVELAAAGKRIILQRGHGFVTWGSSVGEAAFYLWAAERAAAANLALRGTGVRLPDDVVDRWTLTPETARAHFEPAFTLEESLAPA